VALSFRTSTGGFTTTHGAFQQAAAQDLVEGGQLAEKLILTFANLLWGMFFHVCQLYN
jgi:hypothetical protein